MFSIKLPKDLLHVQMNKKLYVWISNHNYHQWVNHVLHSVHLKDVHQRMNLIQVLFYKIGLPQRTSKLFYYPRISIWIRILLLILPLEDDVNAMDMPRNVLSTGKKMISFFLFVLIIAIILSLNKLWFSFLIYAMTDSELLSYANRVKNMSRDWTIVRLHDWVWMWHCLLISWEIEREDFPSSMPAIRLCKRMK